MKIWIKLIKHFQGGSHSDYMLIDPKEIDTKSKEKEVMSNWGENSDGGHAYGYRVDMLELDKDELPPKEWLEKEIQRITDDIGYKENYIERQRILLMEYAVILNKLK
jgi:hypothetical protein